MYVETDFLLALAKQSDWLQYRAESALSDYDELETTIVPFIELLLISERIEFDRTRAVSNLLDLVQVRPEAGEALVLKAATFQDEHGATTFDAFNAASPRRGMSRSCPRSGSTRRLVSNGSR